MGPSNPQEIVRGTNQTISVIGGIPPFTWSVSGQGFSIDNSQGRTAVLSADETACGSAMINVVDSLDAMVSGSLREPNNGSWVRQAWADNQCILKGTGVRTGINAHIYYAELVKGGKKQLQGTIGRGGGGCNLNLADCADYYCPNPCSQFTVPNCIEPEIVIPCRNELIGDYWIQYYCAQNVIMYYYEWKCP